MTVLGQGNSICYSSVNGLTKKVTLKNVQYFPTLKCKLISIDCIRKHGCCVTFDTSRDGNGICIVEKNTTGSVPLTGYEDKAGLYEIVLHSASRYNALRATEASPKFVPLAQKVTDF